MEFLHIVREYEINEVCRCLGPGMKVLEIGAGSGYQSKCLHEHGFSVSAIDVAESIYKQARVFPVTEYDGETFPFEDKSFDVAFSSNALEHIADLAQIHKETTRVLKPGGFGLHVMPSAAWRFWTSLASYVELGQHLLCAIPSLVPRRVTRGEVKRIVGVLGNMARTVRAYAVPPRHGEVGNAITELWSFSRRRWIRHFKQHGFVVLDVAPMGLFYTGHMVLGKRWPLRWRRSAARLLGSACVLYRVRPRVS